MPNGRNVYQDNPPETQMNTGYAPQLAGTSNIVPAPQATYRPFQFSTDPGYVNNDAVYNANA